MRATALGKQCRNVRINMVSRSCPPFAHPAGRRVYKKGPSRAVRRLAYWRKRPVFPQSCRQKPVAVAALAATAALRVVRGPQGKAGLPAWFPRPGLPVSSGAAWCEVHEPYGGGSAPALHGIPFSSRCSGYHCRAYFRRGQTGCQCRTRPSKAGSACTPRLPPAIRLDSTQHGLTLKTRGFSFRLARKRANVETAGRKNVLPVSCVEEPQA